MRHYFTNDDNLKSEEKVITVNFDSQNYKFITDYGVFSKDYLDYGTKTLLETININEELDGNILEVGCGYGALGLILAKNVSKIIEMVDINIRALNLCKRNADLNNVENVKIYESNVYENVEGEFSTIVTNPPIRAGKKIVHQILNEAYDYLVESGELFVVMKKQHGAASAIKTLETKYSNVEILRKHKGYFIIHAKK